MPSPPRDRFTLIDLPAEKRRTRFARDVMAGLSASPKTLPCCYFYDRLGSRLFEAICELPEYYLTRAETAILQARASEIAALFSGPIDLIELGSGSAVKTRLLIEALFETADCSLRYVPIDICRTVLEETARDFLPFFSDLEILAIAAGVESWCCGSGPTSATCNETRQRSSWGRFAPPSHLKIAC